MKWEAWMAVPVPENEREQWAAEAAKRIAEGSPIEVTVSGDSVIIATRDGDSVRILDARIRRITYADGAS